MAPLLALIVLLQAAPPARPAAISGQVLLRDGSPAVAVRVAAIAAPPPNIRPADGQNYYASVPPASFTLTDANGRYRLANVPAGRFYIVAGIIGHATFHPTTTDIDAATIVTTTAGAALENMDFRMLTAPGARVTGRITPPPFADTPERAVLSGVAIGDLLDTPVEPDGRFDFGRIPEGEYFVSLIPQPPGLDGRPFRVGAQDALTLDLSRPPTQAVTGKLVVQNGPLPPPIVGFYTEKDYVSANVNADGSFTVRLHDARYRVDAGGMPVGYSLLSVRLGNQEVRTTGFTAAEIAKSGIVITVSAPPNLPAIVGRVVGRDGAPAANMRVTLRGPIVGGLEATTRPDGSFQFGAVPPGLYRLTVPQMPEIAEATVVVDWGGAEVRLAPR